jgi:hypothetical protein
MKGIGPARPGSDDLDDSDEEFAQSVQSGGLLGALKAVQHDWTAFGL